MKYLVLLIVLIMITFILEKVIFKLFGVEKKKISETPGRNVDRWGRGIILVIFLSTLWFVINMDSYLIIKLYWMTYLTLLLGFQSLLEFIYLKNSKQYVTTLVWLLLGNVIIYYLDNLFIH